jgi:asparagine synthase (glutamine-hydrolysing)
MCGICGIGTPFRGAEAPDSAGTVPVPVPRELIASMCRTLIHRGPDDEGIFTAPGVGLGVRRLSIIDLVTGHQPISNEDGTIWIAFNGEIYNFPEVKDELERRGHRFRSRTDTETVAHGYEEWGEACLDRFRGMFAFALWDGRRRRLLLVRDRIGVKPLYYTLLGDGTIVFGSELKAVIAHPGVRRELDPRALDLFLTVEYVPAPLSIFKKIYKLPAGHILEYKDGTVGIKKYWDLEPQPELIAKPDGRIIGEVEDRLYELLRESVKLRLLSDVPLGAFLSGGIDSSAIVAMMRELGANPLKTFSIGFEDETYNELEHARRVAKKFETDHEEFIIRPQALDLTEELIRHLDEPFGDSSVFPTYLVSKMARQRVTVILSGDGGDEVFAGYEHYQAQRLSRNPLVAAGARAASPLIRLFPPTEKKKGFWNKMQRFVQGFDHGAADRHLRWMMFLSRADKARLYTADFKKKLGKIEDLWGIEPFENYFKKAKAFDPVNGELYLDFKTYLTDAMMVKADRMSMAASLEAREPLLDHKLVEFVFGLGGDWKLHGRETKWIFKKTMETVLPRENVYRPKEGFSIPIKHWLRNELREMMLDRLSEKRVNEGGLFEYGAVKPMIDAHLAGRKNYSHQLWALLVFEIWKENYL